jgi:hypothetical protein
MKLVILAAVALMTAVSTLFAQPVEWKPFSSPPDGFTVEFPGTPKMTEEKDQEFTHRKFIVSLPAAGYFVQASDAGEQIPLKYLDGIMNASRDSMAQGLKAKVTEEKSITCGPNPGRVFVLAGPETSASVMLCASGRRTYTVFAGSRTGLPPAGDITRFQNSFKIVTPGAP